MIFAILGVATPCNLGRDTFTVLPIALSDTEESQTCAREGTMEREVFPFRTLSVYYAVRRREYSVA